MQRNILVVDDEANVLNSIDRVLADTDLCVFKAGSAHEALAILKDEKIAVILSDNLMPGMHGIELLTRVKTESPSTIRILMTGYADLDTALRAINDGGVYKFIVKPWKNAALLDVLEDAVERYSIIEALQKSDEATLLSLAQTIELKDPYTRGHCQRVAHYAMLLAEALGMDAEKRQNIKYGSWLHDFGKIGVPEAILNKEAPLSEAEWEIIHRHPQWGAEIAVQAALHPVIVNIIRCHHEKYDGSGYPQGISGRQIPLEARIVSIADSFDAVSSDRPYRKGFDLDESLRIIARDKASCFDPELIEIMLAILKQEKFAPFRTRD